MTDKPKVSKKKPINYNKLVRKWIAKPLAYLVLLATSAYGIRTMLESLQEPVQATLTVLLVLALTYILFEAE